MSLIIDGEMFIVNDYDYYDYNHCIVDVDTIFIVIVVVVPAAVYYKNIISREKNI